MHTCVHVYHIYIYMCVCVCIYVCSCCAHACRKLPMHACVHTFMSVYMQHKCGVRMSWAYTYTPACMHAYIHMHKYMLAYTYIHITLHTCILVVELTECFDAHV